MIDSSGRMAEAAYQGKARQMPHYYDDYLSSSPSLELVAFSSGELRHAVLPSFRHKVLYGASTMEARPATEPNFRLLVW